MRSRPSILVLLLAVWLPLVALVGLGGPGSAAAHTLTTSIVASAPAAAPAPAPAPARAVEPASDGGYDGWTTKFRVLANDQAVHTGARIVLAVLLFIVGWIVAKTVAYAAFQLLGRTKLDNIIAEKLGLTLLLRERSGGAPEDGSVVERFVSRVVFWLVMLLVIVGVLEFAGLQQVASPIQGMVDTVVQALPRVGKAALILLAAWIAGRVLRIFVTGALERAGVDRRFAKLTESREGETQQFSQTIGAVVFWLMIFFGLAGAFDALEIGPIADSLRNAVDYVVSLAPRLAIAALLVIAAWVIGRIVRTVVRNLLQSVGFDKLVARLQLDKLTGKSSPSDLVGLALYAFVMFQGSIAALNKLGLETLSDPLTHMMTRFWGLLPAIAVSVLIVVVGVIVGRLLRKLVATALANVGFDRLMARLGFQKLPDRPDHLDQYSEIVGLALHVGIILLASAQALDNLQLDTWSAYVNAFLAYMVKNVAVALLVVGVGFGLGNYVRDMIRSRRAEGAAEQAAAPQQEWLGEFARYAVLVFAFTMAVRQLDVAEDFVLISFGLSFGALCLAAALAFGLGGREVAADIVKRRYEAARQKQTPPE
ncbi:MAG: mechanosensitive ion channel [Nannocystaceae bacterium]|nr:mechanosensitive ion channel [Nannocystaceae bacterium]